MDHSGLRGRRHYPDLDRIPRPPSSIAPSRLFSTRSCRRASPALPHLRPSIPVQCAFRHLSRSNCLHGRCAAGGARTSRYARRAGNQRPGNLGRPRQCLRRSRSLPGVLGLFRPQRSTRGRPPSRAAPGAFPPLDPLRFRSHPGRRKASVRSTSLASARPFRPRRRESLSLRHFLSRPLLSHRFPSYSRRPSAGRFLSLPEKDLPGTVHIMTRRPSILVAIVLLTLSISFAATLPNEWRSWRYSRALSGFPVEMDHSPVSLGVLPWDVVAHASPLGADFRIVDDLNHEAPYFLSTLQSESKIETRASRILERSFVAGQFTQIVVRITDNPPLDETHGVTLQQLDAEPWFNTYRIATPENDFMYWVETAVSDDAHQWRVVDARSPISRFRKHGLEGSQTVKFDGYSNQRFLRVRILDRESQFPVDSLEISSRSSSEPPCTAIPANFLPDVASEKSNGSWRADLRTANLPVSELLFSTDQNEFYRGVRLSSSQDGKEWSFVTGGEIYRYRQGDKPKESLRIIFPETFARFWRAEIINGDDLPLSNVALEFRGLDRRVTFRAERGRSYRLLYGNARATAPSYDFARIFDPSDRKALALAHLGPEEITVNYADPRPFTERHPNLLWIVVGIAAVLLALAAVHALRSPISSQQA